MSILSWCEERVMGFSKKPWAKFTTTGVVDGSVRYDMAWNSAFLENLRRNGFTGHTEQEIVENFFLGSMIIPKMDGLNEEFSDQNTVSPTLTSENSRFKS